MFRFLGEHDFRKANIAGGFAMIAMLLGLLAFGRDASETEQGIVGVGIFAAALASLFVQYELEYRRERRAERRSRTARNRLAPTVAQPLDLTELEDVVARWPAAEGGRVE